MNLGRRVLGGEINKAWCEEKKSESYRGSLKRGRLIAGGGGACMPGQVRTSDEMRSVGRTFRSSVGEGSRCRLWAGLGGLSSRTLINNGRSGPFLGHVDARVELHTWYRKTRLSGRSCSGRGSKKGGWARLNQGRGYDESMISDG